MKPRGSVAGPAPLGLAAVACGVVLLMAACGSGGSSPAATAPSSPAVASPSVSAPSAAVCADTAALRTALDKLTHVQAQGTGAVAEIKADLANVKAATTKLANQAGNQWQAQTSSLKSALTSLETAVKQVTANPSATAVTSVVTAIGEVTTATQHLFAAVGNRCPSGS